jgi:hypothetical protein
MGAEMWPAGLSAGRRNMCRTSLCTQRVARSKSKPDVFCATLQDGKLCCFVV